MQFSLVTGNQLVQVNGKDVRGMEKPAFERHLMKRDGEMMELTFIKTYQNPDVLFNPKMLVKYL